MGWQMHTHCPDAPPCSSIAPRDGAINAMFHHIEVLPNWRCAGKCAGQVKDQDRMDFEKNESLLTWGAR